MAGERQRRALDPPSQQPVAEAVVKAPQAFEVDSTVINPNALAELPLAGGAQPEKRCLIDERKPVVRQRIPVEYAMPKAYACRAECHGSARGNGDQIRADAQCGVDLVTEGDAARVGVGHGGVEPVHHIRVTDPVFRVGEAKGSA